MYPLFLFFARQLAYDQDNNNNNYNNNDNSRPHTGLKYSFDGTATGKRTSDKQ